MKRNLEAVMQIVINAYNKKDDERIFASASRGDGCWDISMHRLTKIAGE